MGFNFQIGYVFHELEFYEVLEKPFANFRN